MSVTLSGGAPVLANSRTYTFGGDGYTLLAGEAGVFRDLMADVVIARIKNLGIRISHP